MAKATFKGLVNSVNDALLIIEACRTHTAGIRGIQRRLTELERRDLIKSGAVFIWEETESGIKRYIQLTDKSQLY